jgi:hypothetical protein
MAFVWDENVRAAMERLAPIAAKVRTKRLYWIETPDGTLVSNNGFCWCQDCGSAKVRNLRRHDRKNREDYFLDGGWGSEEDGPQFCCCCGVRLRCTLTEHGAQEEIWHFEEFGLRGGSADDAYEIRECLVALECRAEEDEDAAELAARAVEIARRFLAEEANAPSAVEPA